MVVASCTPTLLNELYIGNRSISSSSLQHSRRRLYSEYTLVWMSVTKFANVCEVLSCCLELVYVVTWAVGLTAEELRLITAGDK
jgi:fructose-1,6-bisphosphatase/inositol monophosphatase family enzyme